MNNISELGPKVVFVHDQEHGDLDQVLRYAAIPLPVEVHNFVDPHPTDNLDQLKVIEDVSRDADILVVPKSLLRLQTTAVLGLFRATRLRPNKSRQWLLIDDDYRDPNNDIQDVGSSNTEVPR